MANTDLERKYFFKKQASEDWVDITKAFLGVKVLGISGFGELGDAVNIYNEQWQESQEEDFLITGASGKIVRKNIDLSMNIIISRRYVDEGLHDFFDEQDIYDKFVGELLETDFYVYSEYTGMYAHVVCNKSFKPTTTDLQRGAKSHILVTIPLHCLDKPTRIVKECSSGQQTNQN